MSEIQELRLRNIYLEANSQQRELDVQHYKWEVARLQAELEAERNRTCEWVVRRDAEWGSYVVSTTCEWESRNMIPVSLNYPRCPNCGGLLVVKDA